MCWCLQTTVARLECAGVTVSVGIAPNLSATRCERTLSGEIRETRRSTWGRFCAQSRMAAAASVAYPCPQNARVNAQPSSGLPACAHVDGVQSRVSKIITPAWPTTCGSAAAVSKTNAPTPSVLQPSSIPSMIARTSSTAETRSLPKPCITSASEKRSYRSSASCGAGTRRQSLSVWRRCSNWSR